MSVSLLSYYGIFFLGIVLGAFLSLVFLSLMLMAQKGDEYLERLESELRLREDLASTPVEPGKSEDLGSPANLDLGKVGASQN
jgi:hypothetical protein